MAGFWQNLGNLNNPNVGFALNHAVPGANQVPNYGVNVTRALLNSIPLNQRLVSNASVKTTSVITLPPSLAKRRKGNTPVDASKSIAVQTTGVTCPVNNTNATSSSMSQCSPPGKNSSSKSHSSSNFAIAGKNSQCSASATASSTCTAGTAGSSAVDFVNPIFPETSQGNSLPVSRVDEPRHIILDPVNAPYLKIPYNAQRVLHDNDYLHKFTIIGGAKLDREKVLKRLLEAAEPSLLLPFLYQEEGEDTTFYARQCGTAIEKLVRNFHLCLELDGSQVYFRIHLQCAPINKLKVNAVKLLRHVLEKRWSKTDRILDLSDFQHDAELGSFMFCPLSQPCVLQYVLQIAINHSTNFSTLILAHNGIRQLKLDILGKSSYLRSLDLSHNELLYQKDLLDLKELRSITKLVLDGNPLCSEFRTPEAYISTLKSIMPQLISLDHVSLFSGPVPVMKEQNFLCTKTGYNLVDQFLKHFFDRYDWTDRRSLDGLYHANALFSLTCIQIPGQTTSESSKLTWYTSYNRNLMKLCDYSKAEKLIYHGPSEILDLFCSLPASEHDPYTMSVDLMHYNEKAAVVSVAGVFREHPTMPPDSDFMRAFRRVFTLCCVGHNEWQIVNEQLHLSNPTSKQAEVSFKIKRPPLEAPVAAWLIQDAQLLTEEEKDQMSNIMMQITTMNKQYATRFLEESHWYVREALIAFVNQHENKLLPPEAFAASSK